MTGRMVHGVQCLSVPHTLAKTFPNLLSVMVNLSTIMTTLSSGAVDVQGYMYLSESDEHP